MTEPDREASARLLLEGKSMADLYELLVIAERINDMAFDGFDRFSGLPCRYLELESGGKRGPLQMLDAVLRRLAGREVE